MRYLPSIFLGVGLLLFGVAAWAYYADAPTIAKGDAIEIDRSELDKLVSVPLAPGVHEFALRLKNTSDKPQRVVGFATACGINCCFQDRERLPVVIPAGEAIDLRVGLHVAGYDIELDNDGSVLYLDDNGRMREYSLVVTGQATATPE